jgi:hypothetical protein
MLGDLHTMTSLSLCVRSSQKSAIAFDLSTTISGGAKTMVWEGRHREVPPYPDP